MAQKCDENRSRNRARQKNGKKCEKVIQIQFWGQSSGMSGAGRQSLGRQDGGSALGKSQILSEASEVSQSQSSTLCIPLGGGGNAPRIPPSPLKREEQRNTQPL